MLFIMFFYWNGLLIKGHDEHFQGLVSDIVLVLKLCKGLLQKSVETNGITLLVTFVFKT